MRSLTTCSIALSLLSVTALAGAAGGPPVPPIKPGLWEVKSTALDAAGKPQAPPEQAAMANMPPEVRERMAAMMKSRGVQMADANGVTRVCQTKESLGSGRWQAAAASMGCTSDYTVESANAWKFHSSCEKMQARSDGEVRFPDAENYTMKITSSTTIMGKASTSTRVMQGHWVGANCGDIKPFDPDSLKAP
jgi:hypothetical protein